MSTIRVNNLQNTSTTDGGISINNSGHVTVDGVAMPSAGPLSNRNLIINGAMQVAQRGTGPVTSVDGTSTEGYQTVDRFDQRFTGGFGNTGQLSVQQSATAPTGFENSYHIRCSAADTSITGNSYIRYRFEGQDIVNSGWDQTDPNSNLTLSFYVRADHTGTYCVNAVSADSANYSFTKEYTIAAANTWQRVSFQIPGISGLTIANDHGNGFELRWILATDDKTATDNVWKTDGYSDATSNQDNFFDAVDKDFYITGIQLEVGSVATPFEHRSYADELRRCQRYYVRRYGASHPTAAVVSPFMIAYSTTSVQGSVILPEEMRASPTLNKSGTFRAEDGVTAYSSTGSFAGQAATTYGANFWLGGFSGLTQYRGYYTGMDGTTSWFDFSAEL